MPQNPCAQSSTDNPPERTPEEWVAWLLDAPNERAIRVPHDTELGDRYYAIIDSVLHHHPGTADDRTLGLVSPTTTGKLSYDNTTHNLEETTIEHTPF